VRLDKYVVPWTRREKPPEKLTTREQPMHPADLETERLLQECERRFQRRSGPGGQHRNKVATGVVLVHRPTGIRAEATERRSQVENQQEAVRRLRIGLALAVRCLRDGDGPVSQHWQERCRSGRMEISTGHHHFPALLAELLDEIDAADYDLHVAAERFGVSASQVVKCLKLEPRAFQLVNGNRQQRNLRPLR
jgi:hypothetical protein